MKKRTLPLKAIIVAGLLAILFGLLDVLIEYIAQHNNQLPLLEFALLPSPVYEVVHRVLYALMIFVFTVWIVILLKRREDSTEREKQISARLNHLLTSSPTIIYAVKVEGNRLIPSYMSESVTRLLGYTVLEVMDPAWWATHIHPDDRERIFANAGTLFDNNFLKHEYRFVRKDGSSVWVHDEVRLLRDDGGKPIEAVGYWIDITESKKADELIKESEKRFYRLYNNSTIGLYRTTPDGKILLANPALVEMLGYDSFEELAKRDLEKFGYVEAAKRNEFKTLLDNNDIITGFEAEWYRKDRTTIFVSEGSKAVRDTAGNILYYDGTVEDITERKKAEDALQESEKRYRDVVENASDIIYSTDLKGKFTHANVAALRAIGYPLHELRKLTYLDVILPEYRGKVRTTYFRQFLEKQSSSYVELPFLTNSGNVRWFEQNASLMLEGDSVVGFHVIARDITERKQAEDAVRESGLRFRTVWEKVNDGMRVTDEEGTIILVNDAYCKMVEKPREEIVGKPLSVIFEKDRQANVLRKHQERFRSRSIAPHLERDIVLWNGKKISLELSNTFLEIPHQPLLLLGVFRDITERKHAEESLLLSERKYKNIFDFAPLGIYQSSLDGRFITVNNSLTKMLGYDSPDEMMSLDMAKDVYFDDKQRAALIAQFEPQGSVANLEILWKKKNGTPIWIQLNSHAVKDEGGKTLHFEGFVRDITERKHDMDKIQEQARLLEEASDAIIQQDLQHNILYWNKSAERIFGWRSEEVLGKDIREILYKGKTEETNAALEIVLKEGAHEQESRYITKSGKKIAVNKRITIIRDDAGKPKSILSINTDITEKKNLESQILRTQRLESLGTLAGGIAHDLNNVLSPILLSIEILKESISSAHDLKLMEMIENSALRGSDIVKQVLGFARGKEGNRIILQVRHIAKETISFIKHTFPKSISVSEDIPKDLWTVLGDATQVHQLLMNLCVNARDAMPQGGTLSVSLENKIIDEHYARLHVDAKPGNYLMMLVKDTGIGMTPEIRDRIFEPFFTTKEQGRGTGFGLSTAYSIVKSHGGFITIESEVGKGTALGIYLPAFESAHEPAGAVEMPSFPSGNGELILIVDDEESILNATKQTLESFKYRTLTASDGTEAVDFYASRGKEIALVLTDLMMPVMDGAATIRALRTMNPSVKIIASSGLVDKRLRGDSEDTAADAFIAKPYTADMLLSMVQQVLHKPS